MSKSSILLGHPAAMACVVPTSGSTMERMLPSFFQVPGTFDSVIYQRFINLDERNCTNVSAVFFEASCSVFHSMLDASRAAASVFLSVRRARKQNAPLSGQKTS
jgi:hypothetical protein